MEDDGISIRQEARSDQQVETKNPKESDELALRIVGFINNDPEQILFFNDFFGLPPNKSLQGQSFDRILDFILHLFLQDEIEITFNALRVINRLFYLRDPPFEFLCCTEFYTKSIQLLDHPIKMLGRISLATLTNLLSCQPMIAGDLISHGLLDNLFKIIETSCLGIEESDIHLGLCAIGEITCSLLKSPSIIDSYPNIYSICYKLLMFDDSEAIKLALAGMTQLAEQSFEYEINQEILDKFLLILENGDVKMIDGLFSLISNGNLKEADALIEDLNDKGLFSILASRMDDEPNIAVCMFRFFDANHMLFDDKEIIDFTLDIIKNKEFPAKRSAISYMSTLIRDLDIQLSLYLASEGIFESLEEFITTSCKEIIDAIDISYHIILNLIDQNVNLEEVPYLEDFSTNLEYFVENTPDSTEIALKILSLIQNPNLLDQST